jgi:hypothetical protein
MIGYQGETLIKLVMDELIQLWMNIHNWNHPMDDALVGSVLHIT